MFEGPGSLFVCRYGMDDLHVSSMADGESVMEKKQSIMTVSSTPSQQFHPHLVCSASCTQPQPDLGPQPQPQAFSLDIRPSGPCMLQLERLSISPSASIRLSAPASRLRLVSGPQPQHQAFSFSPSYAINQQMWSCASCDGPRWPKVAQDGSR